MFPISASQVARITGVSYYAWQDIILIAIGMNFRTVYLLNMNRCAFLGKLVICLQKTETRSMFITLY
jgi:hypothetical protein